MRLKQAVLYTIGLVFTLCLVPGCTEDSEQANDREIREKTAQAMAELGGYISEDKITAAQGMIQSALSKRTGGARDSALLIDGNLKLMDLRSKALELDLLIPPVMRQFRIIQEDARRVSQIQLQKQQIDQLILEADKEIQELKDYLNTGTDTAPSLHRQLEIQQTALADLTNQKAQWQQKAQDAERTLQALQQQADDALEQADLASGTQKAELETSGYQRLLQKKNPYIQKQEALDQISSLEDQIELVQPTIRRLNENIDETTRTIASLQQSPQLQQLRNLQQDLNRETLREQQALAAQVRSLEEQADTCRKTWQTLQEEMQQALEVYSQIRSRELQATVYFKQGQIQALLGSHLASRLYFESELGLAIEGLIESSDKTIESTLRPAMAIVAEDELIRQAMENYDKADESFASALSAGSGLGKDFQADVTKSRLLTLDEKMRLADRMDRYELAEAAQSRLDTLRQEAVEKYGPTFTLSETARLLEKGLDYAPRVPFDSTLFFDSIKSQLSKWRTLQGPQQEQEAHRTLEQIRQLETQADETLLKLLAPEKQAIETAIEQGFPEQAAGGSSSQPAEPNGF